MGIERKLLLNPIYSIVAREAELAINVNPVTVRCHVCGASSHTLVGLALGIGADAHLSAFIAASGTATHTIRRRRVELAMNKAVVRVWSSTSDARFIDDTSPNCGKRQEDANNGEDLAAEYRNGLVELKSRKNGWTNVSEVLANLTRRGTYLGPTSSDNP